MEREKLLRMAIFGMILTFGFTAAERKAALSNHATDAKHFVENSK